MDPGSSERVHIITPLPHAVWNYDAASGWLAKAALPTPRWNPVCGFVWPRPASSACPECGPSAANTHGREVVVAGGYGGGQVFVWPKIPTDTVEIFNFDFDYWRTGEWEVESRSW